MRVACPGRLPAILVEPFVLIVRHPEGRERLDTRASSGRSTILISLTLCKTGLLFLALGLIHGAEFLAENLAYRTLR